MYIIGLNGSPNEDGNTAFMIKNVLDTCNEKGAETELINVSKAIMSSKLPFCTVCSNPCSRKCYLHTDLETVFEKMAAADGIIIGSPVYFGIVSAQLKALFDKSRYLRSKKVLIGKPGAAISVGASKYGGQEYTVDSIHKMMMVHGMTIVGDGHIDFDAGHHGVSAQRPVQSDNFALARLSVLAERLFDMAKQYEPKIIKE